MAIAPSDVIRTMGPGMWKSWVGGAVILASLAGTCAVAEECRLKQVGSLEMVGGGLDRVVVELTVGDKPRRFVVDTGGVISEIYDDVVAELKLSTQPINPNLELYDVKGNVAKRFVRLPKVVLGNAQGENWAMVVRPRAPAEDRTINGIIGPDILKNFDLDFDFAAKKLNLMSPDHCEGKVVYWAPAFLDADFTLSDERIVVPMTLDGKDIQAIVDTGASVTAINESVSVRLFGLDTQSKGIEHDPEAAPDSSLQYRHRFKVLSLAGLAINNPLIYIFPDLAQKSFFQRHHDKTDFEPQYAPQLSRTELLLGMNVLRKLHLYVAYKERKLYITSADAH